MWKTIDGFPNYEISNEGQVRNKTTGKVKRAVPQRKGYLALTLHVDGKQYTKKIHRLVAEAFIPNPLGLPQVNHKDGYKINNYDWNLEWCTNTENREHAMRNNLVHSKAVNQYNLNGEFIQQFKSVLEASKSIGMHQRNLSKFMNGYFANKESYKGFKWEYAENDPN